MKSTQLLSVVFSLIMFTGVTAGSTAFADTDDLEDRLEDFCEMNIEQQRDLFTDYPDMAEYDEKLSAICDIVDEEERDDALDDFIFDVVLARDDVEDDFNSEFEELEDEFNDDGIEVEDDRDNKYDRHADLDDRLEHFCDMTTDEKRQFFADHPRLAQFSDRLENYCDLSEDDRENEIDKFVVEHKDIIRDYMKDKVHDKITDMDYDRLCSMAESDRAAEITDVAKLDRISKWCNMTPKERADYKTDHMKDVVKDHMMDKFSHMDFKKYCSMTNAELATATFDREFVEKASKWCDMTPEEREDYLKDHMKDKVSERIRMSDMSPRLKAMIMDKHEISDEKREEIKMKYREKYGELTDEKKSELKMKFKDHMEKVKIKISDERRSAIHDRLSDMKAFKAELREKASEMTDEEKQQLREEFIQKAKDMQLAWISPRTQITAGIDAAEVECREGFSLVMKASNGVPMCLKADTALKMIDRGIVVPTN
ncbi:ABC transporter substrate-binding protein [Nitrosopumilus sp. b3]|uniref:ABC transporter substrate-binding protein n=1 Tax=Nitrosopumilus sp. b3 TaxID=2109909 RepID=UPI0015F49490|nr:ABC transporter substrate-binding protein [Nitrosopumilus sp. b3]KAF6246823.1 ABC transporter substrate-binding protein [Nitrosopumilus sp. b3]